MFVIYSPLVSQVSGSAGELVAAHNRYGPYLRHRAGPAASGSLYWQAIKDNTASLLASWQALSYASKLAWRAASDILVRSFGLGSRSTLPAYNYYLSVNGNRLLAGLAAIPLPPPPGFCLEISVAAATADVSAQQVVVNASSTSSEDLYTKIFATKQISLGVTYYSNQLRLVAVVETSLLVDYDLTAAYLSRFIDPLVLNRQIFFKLINFNSYHGSTSEPYHLRIVTTL
jgi:hypothetical protein